MRTGRHARLGVLSLDRRSATGYLFGLLTAACWAASPVFLAKGLDLFASPLWAVTIGLGAATVPFVAWLAIFRRPPRLPTRSQARSDPRIRVGLRFLGLAGVASAVGAVARTFAIDLAPIVVVVPILQTTALWTLLLSPLVLGQHKERITMPLVSGAVIVVAGAILVVIGQAL